MRRTLTSTLFLSTALLSAHASTKGQGFALEAHNHAPNALTASVAPAQPITNSSPEQIRISSVVQPKLTRQVNPKLGPADFHAQDLESQKLVLHFVVDESGTPQHIEIIKSVNQDVDERVLDAVRQYRYSPARLDGQVVASDLNLEVRFQHR
jgi:TonB family protein